MIEFLSTSFGIAFVFLAGFLAGAQWRKNSSERRAKREAWRRLLKAMQDGFEDEPHVRLVRLPYDHEGRI